MKIPEIATRSKLFQSGKTTATLIAGVALWLAATKLPAANVNFSPGSYVIDMGVMPQSAANGLKPYGLVYNLVTSNGIPVSWAINPNKVTDKNPAVTVEGVDFTIGSKSYRGGPFIIPAEYITPAISNLITTWRAKGVVVDGPIANSFTAPIYNVISSFPNVILDAQHGDLVVTAFFGPAEIPASAYHTGEPGQVALCDDIYVMPHSSPNTWNAVERAKFLTFVLAGGSLWADCHGVSGIEAFAPTFLGDNFLSTKALVPWNAHSGQNTVPFAYNTNQSSIWTEPLMQFVGKVDQALQGGGEEIFVPNSAGWAAHAKVAVFDKFYADARQPWISHSNPAMAGAMVVFGRAFNNPNYGQVMYVASHQFQAGGPAENTAVARIFGNMLMSTSLSRRPAISLSITNPIQAGDTVVVSATVNGTNATDGAYLVEWSSSCGGTFGNPNATTTTFTPPPSGVTNQCVVRATIHDTCNRTFSSTVVIDVTPTIGPTLYKTAAWTNAPGPGQPGDQIDYQIKMDNYSNQIMVTGARITDNLPPNTSYKAGSASPPLSSGPDPLVWQIGTNLADIPGVVVSVVTNTFSATSNTFDTYLDRSDSSRNFGGATNLIVSGNATHERRSLVRFDLSSISTNATVMSATLTLTKIGGTANSPRNVSVHRVTNAWTENTLNGVNGQANWPNRTSAAAWATPGGDFVSTGESTNTISIANGAFSWNVTAAANLAVSTPGLATTNGFLFRFNGTLPQESEIFASSENVTNGPRLVVVYSTGIGTTTRLKVSPYRIIGSQNSLPTVDVTMVVAITGNRTNLTITPPASLTVSASAGASAVLQAGYPAPPSAIVPAGGGIVTFTYKYNVTSLGAAPGSLSFSGKPANGGGATYVDAISDTILTVPTLNYSVQINAPLPFGAQRVPNTARFNDNVAFPPGINDIISTEAIVPLNNTNPDIGIAKALTSVVNLADGRYTVAFDLNVTNLGSVTIRNVQVGESLNAAFSGRPLSGLSVSTTPNLTLNPAYNGVSNTNLLAGTNELAAGVGGKVSVVVTVTPGTLLNHTNQAFASATDVSGTILSTDLSDNGSNPDPNNDGDPTEAGENDPTPILLSEHPAITLTKDLTSLAKNPNGTFALTYSMQVENPGDVNLANVQVSDRLATSFPPPATFTVNSLSSSEFTVNAGFNGLSDTNLLASGQTLGAGAQGLITLSITVNRNGGTTASFTNRATASAVSPASQNVTSIASAATMLEIPTIAITKQVTGIVGNGTNFDVSMRINVANIGDVVLTNVQAVDDLSTTFSDVLSFTVLSKTATGLTVNTNYDGLSDINLLIGTNSLAIGATGSVSLTVRVIPDLGSSWQNQASGSGTSTSPGGETVTGFSGQVTIQPSLIQGTVYLDQNTNGVFDAGDNGLPYVDVVITTSSNATFTVASDSIGHFVALVPPGNTTVNINELDPQFPTNAILTVGSTDPTTVSVPVAGSAIDDTGYVLPPARGIVNGYLFLDNDGDGLYDTSLGDTPILNVDVQVVDKNAVTNVATTDSHGYFLKVVPAGVAIVKVVSTDADFPAGKVLTVNDYGFGSDPTMLVVPDGGIASDDTGYVTPDPGTGEVIGIVYLDRNTNGVFDVADLPLVNLNVSITETNGATSVVTTDPGGFYSLVVEAGLTTVNVLTNSPAFPPGATVTIGTTNPSTLNVPDGGMARTDKGFRLPSGQGMVNGVVYLDNDNNGLYELGVDTPIPNITVNVTDTNGVVHAVTTSLNGDYSVVVSNGITIVDVDTSDPDFPPNLQLTSNAHGEGTDPTTVLVSSSTPSSVNVGYSAINFFPLAAADTAYTKENVAVGGNVLANDSLGDLPVSSLTVATNPGNGMVLLAPNGAYTYTPNSGFYGTDSFVYRLCDANGDCATAPVTITVNSVPFANNDTVTVNEDTLLSGSVATNDIPSGDGGNVWSLLSGVAHGNLNLNPNGTYTYLPNTNYVGSDSFTYRLCDVDSDCSTGAVSITVVAVNDAPVAFNQNIITPEDTGTNVVLTGIDVDSTNLTFAILVGPTNGAVTGFNTNTGALLYTPATNYNGPDSFTFAVSDGSLQATGTVSITVTPVNDAPVAVNDSTSTPRNVPVLIPVLANDSDVDGDTLSITGTSPTNGVASIVGTNVLFMPFSNFVGVATIGYTITDGNGGNASALVTVHVTLGTNTPPVAVNDTATTAEDTPVTISPLVNDSDVDGDTLTITGASTTNGTVSNVGGTNLFFTPALNFNGTVTLSYTISDGMGGSASANVTVTVTPVNDGPIAGDQLVTTPEDVATNLVLTATDVDSTNLTFAIVVGPTNGVISALDTNTGALLYTPATNYHGPDSFTFAVSDGSLQATGLVSITVTPINDGPVAHNQSLTTPEDVSTNLMLTATDVDSTNLTFAIVVGPTNGTIAGLDTNTGAMFYTPATNYNGPDSFSFVVSDGSLQSTGAVSITVTPVNDAPIANNQSVTTPEDVATNLVLTASDVDSTNLTFTVVAGPTNGAVSGMDTNTGALLYTPATNYHGPDSFTFAVSDGSLQATGTVSITVTPVNDAPVAVDDLASTPRNVAVLIPVLANDSDVDGDTLSITGASPTNGIASIVGTNVVFTPLSNFVGVATIGYSISDGNGGSASALVTVTVTLGTNTTPVAVNDTATTAENTPVTIAVLANDFDVDGDTLSIISANTTNGTVSNLGGTNVFFTPALNFNGTVILNYSITDGMGGSASAIVTVTVTPINDAPVAGNQFVTTPEDVATNLVLTASDVDSTNLTFAILTGPTNGTFLGFDTNSGAITYRPATNYSGPDGFSFMVSDGSLQATGTVSITVTPVNDAPVADNQSVTTPEDVATNLVLTASDVDSTNLTFAILANPSHGTVSGLDTNSGALLYRPATNYHGPDSFTFTVSDGSLLATGTVSITVTPVNDAPVAMDDSTSTPRNVPVLIPVLANDSDVDGDTLSIASTTIPNATIVGTNVLFTPGSNFVGVVTFGYSISDGNGGSASALVTVNVTLGTNTPPVAVNDSATTPEDTALTIAPLANDFDVDGDTLTITSMSTTNGTVSNVGGTNLFFTPTPNFNGTVTLNYSISDGMGGSASAIVTVTVTPINDAPVAANQFVTTPEDVATNLVLIASDVDSTNLTFAILNNPTNGAISGLDTNTGALLYRPATNYFGPDSFTFTVSDGSLQSTGTVSITVTPVNDAPVADNQSVTTPEDVATNLVLTASDVDSTNLTFAILANPSHGTVSGLDINTGALLYRPATNYHGPDSFTFTASDGGLQATGTVSITVTPVNDAPVAVDDSISTPRNVPVLIPVLANDNDVDGDTLSITSTTIPNATIVGTNVLFTPGSNFVGVATFGYSISDGHGGSASALVTVNVTLGTNTPPVAINDTATTAEDTPVTIAVLANDFDVDGDTLSIISASTTNGTVSNLGGTNLFFTPALNFNGTVILNYSISDGMGGSASAVVTVTVTPINDAPVAGNQFVTTPEDVATNLLMIATDVDSTNLTFAIVTGPTNGVISGLDTNTGTLLYTPATNYHGPDSFTFAASDGSLQATGTVSITVTPVNDAPVAVDDSTSTPRNLPVLIPVLANDSDVDGDPLSITGTSPTNGTASIVGTNVLFTPTSNFVGVATIGYTISDGNGGSASALVTVNVTLGTNTPPVAVNDTATTPEDTSVTIAPLVNDFDVDGDTLTITGASTTNGTVSNVGGTNLFFTPALNFNGAVTLSYTISDGMGGSASANVTVTVTPVNDGPVAGDQFVTTPEDVATNLVLTATDVDSTNLTFAIVVGPTNGVISGLDTNTGALLYTPTTNYNGPDSFSFAVSDGSLQATGMVSITVTPVNDAPTAGDQFVITPEDVATNLVLVGSDVDSTNLTFAIVAGPTHGVLSGLDTNTGALLYTPVTNYNGPDTFTFVVSDGSLQATGTVSITVTPVNDAPVAVNDSTSTPRNVPVLIPVLSNDSDVDGDTLSITGTSPTNGTSSIVGTNVLFTPSSNFVGVATIGYGISDGNGGNASALITVFVTLGTNTPPVAVNDTATTPEDTSVTIAPLVNDFDADGDTLTITGASTTNGTVSNVGGTNLFFTPALNFNGTVTLSYTISDGMGGSASANVTVTVTPVNDGPIAGDQFVTIPEDVATNLVLIATDVDSTNLTFTIVAGPTNGVVSGLDTNTGALLYTPATNYNGLDSFTFAVSDGSLQATGTVSITVTPVNDAPLADNQSVTTPEDVATNLVLTATDVDSTNLTFAILVGPTHGLLSGLDTNTGALLYLPATNYNGPDSFTFSVSDGSLQATGTVSITVTPVNDAPVAVNDSTSTPRNVPVLIPVLANDSDVDGDTLSITGTSPTNGIANIVGTNVLFTPFNNFVGIATIGYSISDGNGGSASALVTVNVTLGTNTPPVAVNDEASTSEDTPVTIAPLVNDFDVDGDTLTITSASTTNGTVNNVGGTNLFFTPALNFNGTVTLSYTIGDGMGGSASATVTVTVDPVNDGPVAGNQSVTTPENVATNIFFSATDVDSTNLTFAVVVGPTNGILSNLDTNAGTVRYIPATNYHGPDSLTFVVSDGSLTATGIVSISVIHIYQGPAASNDVAYTHRNTSVTIWPLANDSSPDGMPLTISSVSPTNGTATIAGGTSVVFKPKANSMARGSIRYTNSDGNGGHATAMITVFVTNRPPIALNDNVTTLKNTPVTILPLLNDSDPDGDTLRITSVRATHGRATIVGRTNVLFRPTTNFVGTASITYRIGDGFGKTASAVITVNVASSLSSGFTVIGGANIFNPQTGLFEQRVTVTNTGTNTAAAVRLLVGGLRAGVSLHNATGTNSSRPFVQYNAPLNPGESVIFRLEFYVPDRRPFTDTLEAEAVLPIAPTIASGGVFVDKKFMDTRIAGEPRFVIEWASVPGRKYTVLYSSDMQTWTAATPSITAKATRTQWYDDGPPKTDSKPASTDARFYRVVVAP